MVRRRMSDRKEIHSKTCTSLQKDVVTNRSISVDIITEIPTQTSRKEEKSSGWTISIHLKILVYYGNPLMKSQADHWQRRKWNQLSRHLTFPLFSRQNQPHQVSNRALALSHVLSRPSRLLFPSIQSANWRTGEDLHTKRPKQLVWPRSFANKLAQGMHRSLRSFPRKTFQSLANQLHSNIAIQSCPHYFNSEKIMSRSRPARKLPISNLPFLSKVLERVVFSRINTIWILTISSHVTNLPTRNIIQLKLYILARVVSDLISEASNAKHTSLARLDLSAAFDTVDHNKLIQRLSLWPLV